jgi:hypothetical protein
MRSGTAGAGAFVFVRHAHELRFPAGAWAPVRTSIMDQPEKIEEE